MVTPRLSFPSPEVGPDHGRVKSRSFHPKRRKVGVSLAVCGDPEAPLHSLHPDLSLDYLAHQGWGLGFTPVISTRITAQTSPCWLSCSLEVEVECQNLMLISTNCWLENFPINLSPETIIVLR